MASVLDHFLRFIDSANDILINEIDQRAAEPLALKGLANTTPCTSDVVVMALRHQRDLELVEQLGLGFWRDGFARVGLHPFHLFKSPEPIGLFRCVVHVPHGHNVIDQAVDAITSSSQCPLPLRDRAPFGKDLHQPSNLLGVFIPLHCEVFRHRLRACPPQGHV